MSLGSQLAEMKLAENVVASIWLPMAGIAEEMAESQRRRKQRRGLSASIPANHSHRNLA